MHVVPYQVMTSHMEHADDAGNTRSDYKTAHSRVGDAGCETWIPGTCQECFKQEISAAELGWVPTSPDQEIPLEVQRGLT